MHKGYKTKAGYSGKGSSAKSKAVKRMMAMYKSGKYATGNVMPGAGSSKGNVKSGYKKTKKPKMGAAYNHKA